VTTAVGTRRHPGLVVLVAFVATLAGRFTLTRLGINVPLLNDVRVPLFAVLLMCLALELRYAGHRPAEGRGAATAVLLLLTYQALSACWSPPNTARVQAVGDLGAIAVLVFVYVSLAGWDRDRVTRATLVCMYAAAWVYFLAAASGSGHTSNGRWAALGGGPNVFVRVMGLGILAAVYLYARDGRRLGWLVAVPAFIIGALASGSRGGLVALIVTLVAAAVAILPRMAARNLGRPLVIVVVVVVVTWVVAGDTIGGLIQQRFVDATLDQGYTSDRDVLFRMAIEVFLRNPFFGTGINGFHIASPIGGADTYVHNLPLAVAAEGGVAGLLLLINAWYQLGRQFARVPRAERSPESRAAVYGGLFVGVACLFSGDYYDARLMWILLILAAVRPGRAPAV